MSILLLLPRFQVNYAHAQTVDTRQLFRGGRGRGGPGDEAITSSDIQTHSLCEC